MDSHADDVVERSVVGVGSTTAVARKVVKQSTARTILKSIFILVVILKSKLLQKK